MMDWMAAYLGKTKNMFFTEWWNRKKWLFQGTEIEIVSLYKYLGLYFTPRLIWTKTKEMLSLQAKTTPSSIFRFQKQFGRFQLNNAFKLLDTKVKPVACYGAEIWGYELCEEIEKVQSKYFVTISSV